MLPLAAWLLGAAAVFLIRPTGTLTLTSLSVGQGDCHVLELPDGSVYLIDGGTGYGDAARKSILPYLQYRGVRRLSYILVSHCDDDHINALPAVIGSDALSVGGLILPRAWEGSPKAEALLEAAQARGVPVCYTGAGSGFEAGGAAILVLYPANAPEEEPDNDSSMVLLLRWQAFSALFTGDRGAAGERILLRAWEEELAEIDWLKVGHHGSRYSSSEAFLRLTSPDYAFISCGRNNLYGHPAPEALKRLEAAGAAIFRTDLDGAVTLTVWADGRIRAETYHRKEETNMSRQEEERITRSTWISCGTTGPAR